jgi:hypothetical protein
LDSKVALRRNSWLEWLKIPPPPALAVFDEKEELVIKTDWEEEARAAGSEGMPWEMSKGRGEA